MPGSTVHHIEYFLLYLALRVLHRLMASLGSTESHPHDPPHSVQDATTYEIQPGALCANLPLHSEAAFVTCITPIRPISLWCRQIRHFAHLLSPA